MTNRLPIGRVSRVGAILGVVLTAFVILVPIMSPYSPETQDPAQKLLAPSIGNPLGTDQFGRDLLTRVADGGRRTLFAAFVVVSATLIISILIGIGISLAGGVVDAVASRLVDVSLAIPSIVLALAIVGVLGVGFGNLLIAVVISLVGSYIRLARAFALAARQRTDVITARLAGINGSRILLTHVAPDVFRRMLIIATLDLGGVILSLAALSFLGLGAQPPDAEWGSMLNESRLYFSSAPHTLLGPGIAILLAIVSANSIGLGLREREDAL